MKIYNNFMANNDPTLKNLERLAEIFKDNQVVHINEQVLRRLPIQKAVDLTREDWVIIFQ